MLATTADAPAAESNEVATFSPAVRSGERVLGFDLLRAGALLSIFLAHVRPPEWLFLLRNFDVPLLILVSGAVFRLGDRGEPVAWGCYLRKRAVRLLAPTYLFLGCYFGMAALVEPERFTPEVIARTFLLLDGIGYVWVIRVFLIVALIAPWLLRVQHRFRAAGFVELIGVAYLLHEVAWLVADRLPGFAGGEVMEYSVFYLLPYGCLFALGLRWPEMSRREALRWAGLALGVCGLLMVALGGAGEPVGSWTYKYPPHLIYVWYGLGMAHLAFAASLSIGRLSARSEAWIRFISAASLWIYLWHILALPLARRAVAPLQLGEWAFVPTWAITATIAIGLTWLQHRGVKALLRRPGVSPGARHGLTLLFLK